MSFQISKGKILKKEFLLVYGPDGVGKSNFGAEAPNPIFIPVEAGSNSLDVARLPQPRTFEETMAMLSDPELKNYETLVFDSLDHFEPLLWDHVVKVHCQEREFKDVTTIEGFGYGKGYTLGDRYWIQFLKKLSELREQMNIVLIAHDKVKAVNDPLHPVPYDEHMIKLQDRASGLVRETVDTALFMNYEVYIKEGKSGAKSKAFGEGKRFVFTQKMPGHYAKNRDGLPYQIPMEKGKAWTSYIGTKRTSDPKDVKILKAEVDMMFEGITNIPVKARAAVAIHEAGLDFEKLNKIYKKMRTMQGDKL